MATLTHGVITVTIPDNLTPHEQAGQLTAKDMQRLAKAPRDVGGGCEDAAAELEESLKDPATALPVSAHITPDALRLAAAKADDTDKIIQNLEYMLSLFKQSNLLHDADAWKLLREVNDAIQSRAKHDPDVLKRFASTVRFFKRRRSSNP
jgi:siderophore synthetase component